MYTPSRRMLAATAALSSALFLAGCASDDDDPIASPSQPVESASPSASAAPTVDQFCDAKAAIDAAFLAGGPPEDEEGATPSPEQVGQGISAAFSAPYAEMERTAQPEVKDAVTKEVDALKAAISSGDSEFFFKPDFVTADKTIDDYLLDECGFNKVSATAREYEFGGLPTVTPAGMTGLTITNEGEQFHEMVFMRINDDVTDSVDDILQGDEETFNKSVVPMGVVLASPGTTATNFFDLKSGRYIVLCFISDGSDAEHDFNGDGPPHFIKGMHEEIRVLPGPGEATASPSSSSDSSSSSSSSTANEETSEPTSGSSSTSSDDEDETSSPEPTSSSS